VACIVTVILLSVKDGSKDGKTFLEVVSAEHTKLVAMVNEVAADRAEPESEEEQTANEEAKKRRGEGEVENEPAPKAAKVVAPDKDEKKKEKRDPKATDIMVRSIVGLLWV
jgi:hypothetical protein